MDAGSPTKRVAALSAAKKVKKQRYAEGKLVAADLEHWAGPLQRAGLLSCTDFSKADGAAEAAGDDVFAAPADADAARDKAYDLLELIEKKAKAGPERELPLAGPALVTEFRKVAKELAGQDDAVKQLLEDLAVEHAKGGAAGPVESAAGGGGGGGTAPVNPATLGDEVIAQRQHAAFAFQNNGEELPLQLRPPPAMIAACVRALGGGPTMQLPELEALAPIFAPGASGAAQPQRHAVETAFGTCVLAAVVAASSAIGHEHLTRMTADAGADKINALDALGHPVMIGGKKTIADGLLARVHETCTAEGEKVSSAQTKKLAKRVWARLNVALGSGRSLSRGCLEAGPDAGEAPAADPPPRRSNETRREQGASSRRRSRSPSPRGRSRGHERSGSRGRSPSRSSSRERSDRRGGKERQKSDFASGKRDRWGGSYYSKHPCHAEQDKRGSCRIKNCEYSHDPEVLKEKRGKKRR